MPGDIDRFIPREDFRAEKDAVAWTWPDGPPPGRTWTLLSFSRRYPLEVLGVGGLYDAGDGCWHAWALLTELTPREWCEAGKLAYRAIAGVELFNAPLRIEATARTSIPGAVVVLEKLGFVAGRTVQDPRMGAVVYQQMVRAA